jgi:hypothetical protein
MRQYKHQLELQSSESSTERAIRIEAFCNLSAALNQWQAEINSLVIADLEEETRADASSRAGRDIEVSQQHRSKCAAAWKRTQDAMSRFRIASNDEFFQLAERLYNGTKSWADDVIDGLWPSTHLGADQHNDLWELETDLFEYASINLKVSEEELILRSARTWREDASELGGSGKRF